MVTPARMVQDVLILAQKPAQPDAGTTEPDYDLLDSVAVVEPENLPLWTPVFDVELDGTVRRW